MQQQNEGSIVCASAYGCTLIAIESLNITCQNSSYSILEMHGSVLQIFQSRFTGCSSQSDGGVIKAFDETSVMIQSVVFASASSHGFGGALVAIGSLVNISNTTFQNCTSKYGGGAIWVTTRFSGYGVFVKRVNTYMMVSYSSFQGCSTEGEGGAIFLSSDSSAREEGIYAEIDLISSRFTQCQAHANGGAISVTGNSAFSNISSSEFEACTSASSGGALSVSNSANAVVVNSVFTYNTAYGFGGGAIYSKNALMQPIKCSFNYNLADNGGGGAMLLAGQRDLISVGSQYNCLEFNSGVYGSCIASNFANFQIIGLPLQATFFPGLPFIVRAVKKDLYNQTILTDSASLVQLTTALGSSSSEHANSTASLSGSTVAKLIEGQAIFQISVMPQFMREAYKQGHAVLMSTTHLYVQGIDAEETAVFMQSAPFTVSMSHGDFVCPGGYILILDELGHGSCSKCGPGTYSIDPLIGIVKGSASCLRCPAGGICNGGNNLSFPLGTWEISNGTYILLSCPPGHQLVNSAHGIFSQDVQECLPCKPSQYILNSNDSHFVCQSWSATLYLEIDGTLEISQAAFSPNKQFEYAKMVAQIASVDVSDVMISIVEQNRRTTSSNVAVVTKVAAANESFAGLMKNRFSQTQLNPQLLTAGLPQFLELSLRIVRSESSSTFDLSAALGASVGGFFVLIITLTLTFFLIRLLWKQLWHKAFLAAITEAKPGDAAGRYHLAYNLQKKYKPEVILGKGSSGCIVQARNKGADLPVAIKFILPENFGRFTDREIRQLKREAEILNMFTTINCPQSVHLAGIGEAHLKADLCIFVMELLNGENLESSIKSCAFDDVECIKAARDVLAALKILHSEGIIHRDVKPANIMRCNAVKTKDDLGGLAYNYKLIDFGSALGIDERIARSSMMTLVSNRQRGAGTPPYMSPEMFREPENAKYPTDLWSLGITMFQLVTGQLPFEIDGSSWTDSGLMWSIAISGNMEVKAPNVMDSLECSKRSAFDTNLANVIAKALEKKVADRYQSVDEMHDSVYKCLVAKGEAQYSVFLSYRVASDAPLVKIIFDELNHSITPAGNRVTVFWDAHCLVKGEDWEDGFASGLLNSLSFFPVLSYGSTAPLACLPPDKEEKDKLLKKGWEDRPVGRFRLQGSSSDPEDNVLKEFLIADTLLQRREAQYKDPNERGILQVAYPILAGRQEPAGHPNYPAMGNFFHVQGGGGRYPDTPSHPTNIAVARFMGEKAEFPLEIQESVLCRSVKSVVESLTRIQGCQLWTHSCGLAPVELSREQNDLIGKGCAGPPVNIDGVELTLDQRACCLGGLDEQQLKMMKAQVSIDITLANFIFTLF